MKEQESSVNLKLLIDTYKIELKLIDGSAGSILDISKYRDTCERSISILGGIAILRYIEYRMNQ